MNIEKLLKTNKQLAAHKKLVINLIVTGNLISNEINMTIKPFGISQQQFNVLRILRGQQGKPANLCTLQERMVSKMSNTTRLVDKLIEKKLVKRHICPSNRRKVEIYITNKGLELLQVVDPEVEQAEKNVVGNLSVEEIETLNHLLDKLRG